jgi:hypothetical protein
MSGAVPKWHISGEYFENCSCDVACPCLVSDNPPMAARPTQGHCAVMFAVHIDRGQYGDVTLDGLNLGMIAYTPGPMGEGNWKIAAYVDSRANEQQGKALAAIFSGAAGGPLAALAPLITENLGAKQAPITYRVEGHRRFMEIPQVMRMAVHPLPTLREEGVMWLASGHPFNPEKLAMAVGESGSTFTDYGMRWDNSGRNAHYAPINWAN